MLPRQHERRSDRRGHDGIAAADGFPDDLVEQEIIGTADRSSWFMGGRPSSSSIVLTMPTWVYCVWSTNPRRVLGLIARATVR